MSYQRINWNEYINTLKYFNPALRTVPADTAARKDAVISTLNAFLRTNLTGSRNQVIIESFNRWRNQAKRLFGAEQFKAITSDKPLFKSTRDREKDIQTATYRYLLEEFGYPWLAVAKNLKELVQQFQPNALTREAEKQSAIVSQQRQKKEERENTIQEEINKAREHELSQAELEKINAAIENEERDIERLTTKTRELQSVHVQLLNKQRTQQQIRETGIWRSYSYHQSFGRSMKLIRHYMRGYDLTQLDQYITIMNEDVEEQIAQNEDERKRIEEEIAALKGSIKRHQEQIARHNTAQSTLPGLRLKQQAIENENDVMEISAAEALAAELKREAGDRESTRVKDRRRQFEEYKEKRAHNKEEAERLDEDANRFAESKDSIDKYFDDYPVDFERIDKTLDSVKPNTQIRIDNFSNEERELLKGELLAKLEELFNSISSEHTVQVRFGRNKGDVKFAPAIRSKKDAYDWLTNWINRSLMIDFNEETHMQLTEGDRNTVADLWTVDWFEIVVHNGASALSMGYSKYYFNRQNKPVILNGVEYDEDFVVEQLKRYQITDHLPTAEDKDVLVPCLIHAVLLLDWSETERKKVSDLMYSRVKYRHVSGPDAAALFEELNIQALIHDHDNNETVEYSAHGIHYKYVNGKKDLQHPMYRSQEGQLFGNKTVRNAKHRQYYTKKIELDVLKKHCMLHDDANTTFCHLSSWRLIQQLINDKRLQLISLPQSWVFNEVLPEHEPELLNSYSSTCWKTPKQVLSFHGHKYDRPKPENLALKKLTINSPELLTKQFDDSNAALVGWSLILNYMIDNDINVMADSGTVKDFMAQSTRGALVSIENNKTQMPNEAVTVLDSNAFYWYCLSQVDVGVGVPRVITEKMNVDDVLKLIDDGAVVFVKCNYSFTRRTNLDRCHKAKVLTNYDIKSGNYILKSDSKLSGFYWSKAQVLTKPFAPFIKQMFQLKQKNKCLKRVINAGIGRLVKKFKPFYYRPYSQNSTHSNPAFLASREGDKLEKWANTMDFSYGFHQLHSLILSYAGFYLQRVLFQHCKDNDIEILYCSTDSIAIKTSQLPKMKEFIGDGCGQFKVEASSDNNGPIYIQKGLYYVNEDKWCARSAPHNLIIEYCAKNNISVRQLFERLLYEDIIIRSENGIKYTFYSESPALSIV